VDNLASCFARPCRRSVLSRDVSTMQPAQALRRQRLHVSGRHVPSAAARLGGLDTRFGTRNRRQSAPPAHGRVVDPASRLAPHPSCVVDGQGHVDPSGAPGEHRTCRPRAFFRASLLEALRAGRPHRGPDRDRGRPSRSNTFSSFSRSRRPGPTARSLGSRPLRARSAFASRSTTAWAAQHLFGDVTPAGSAGAGPHVVGMSRNIPVVAALTRFFFFPLRGMPVADTSSVEMRVVRHGVLIYGG